MRVISQKELTEKLFDHPYENSPDYRAAMSVVDISSDGKLLIGYWHAPKGRVKLGYGENKEHIYIITGKLRMLSSDGGEILAASGDTIQCGGKAEEIECIIEEYVKALFIVYPQSEADLDFVHHIEALNGELQFKVE